MHDWTGFIIFGVIFCSIAAEVWWTRKKAEIADLKASLPVYRPFVSTDLDGKLTLDTRLGQIEMSLEDAARLKGDLSSAIQWAAQQQRK